MQPQQSDVWSIGALLGSLVPTSPGMPGPGQNDPQCPMPRICEESTTFSTHEGVPHEVDESRKPLEKKPQTMNSTGGTTLAHGNLTHNPEDLNHSNDGTSMSSKRPGISEHCTHTMSGDEW